MRNKPLHNLDIPVELLESLKLRGIDFNNKKVVDLGSGTTDD